MTTELEKQFFDTFGIEHEERYYNCKDNLEGKCGIKCPCECCDKSEEVYCYPQITDRQYLELICVLNHKAPVCKSVSLLKETILKQLIRLVSDDYLWITDGAKEEYKHQVQAIFEGER